MAYNKKNLLRLAEAVRTNIEYDQGKWLHGCGAPACIAGTGFFLLPKRTRGSYSFDRDDCDLRNNEGNTIDYEDIVGKWLGLSEHEAYALFDGDGHDWPEPYRTEFRGAHDYGIWSNAVDSRIRRMLQRNVAVRLLRDLANGVVEL